MIAEEASKIGLMYNSFSRFLKNIELITHETNSPFVHFFAEYIYVIVKYLNESPPELSKNLAQFIDLYTTDCVNDYDFIETIVLNFVKPVIKYNHFNPNSLSKIQTHNLDTC